MRRLFNQAGKSGKCSHHAPRDETSPSVVISLREMKHHAERDVYTQPKQTFAPIAPHLNAPQNSQLRHVAFYLKSLFH
jgi:hypothetical protein